MTAALSAPRVVVMKTAVLALCRGIFYHSDIIYICSALSTARMCDRENMPVALAAGLYAVRARGRKFDHPMAAVMASFITTAELLRLRTFMRYVQVRCVC